MTISTQDGLIAAMTSQQVLNYFKSGGITSIAGTWFDTLLSPGIPGAPASLNAGNTANGVVPDDTLSGLYPINAFGAGNTGYIAAIEIGGSVACRYRICDMLFRAGAYSFNSNVALNAQPSYAARVPGADYKGLEIWIEAVTAFTGNLTATITYTNQDGVAGKTAVLATGAALTANRMMQVPLAAGDTGVQKIESVVGSVATVGTFNVLVLRPLRSLRMRGQGDVQFFGPDLTQMPVVYDNSALLLQCMSDGVSIGATEMSVVIVNG